MLAESTGFSLHQVKLAFRQQMQTLSHPLHPVLPPGQIRSTIARQRLQRGPDQRLLRVWQSGDLSPGISAGVRYFPWKISESFVPVISRSSPSVPPVERRPQDIRRPPQIGRAPRTDAPGWRNLRALICPPCAFALYPLFITGSINCHLMRCPSTNRNAVAYWFSARFWGISSLVLIPPIGQVLQCVVKPPSHIHHNGVNTNWGE